MIRSNIWIDFLFFFFCEQHVQLLFKFLVIRKSKLLEAVWVRAALSVFFFFLFLRIYNNSLLIILHIVGFTCVACSVAAVVKRHETLEHTLKKYVHWERLIHTRCMGPCSYTLECNSSVTSIEMHSREKSFRQSEAWLELTTILQLTQLKVLRVGDVLVRGQKEDDVALFVFDRDDIE